MNKIYLCCPYSHKNEAVRKYRFEAANIVAGKLMEDGNVVFSPISHSHPISLHMGNSLSHDFWLKQDFAFVEWADEIAVLQLNGWDMSFGIEQELVLAKNLGKKLRYIPEDYLG